MRISDWSSDVCSSDLMHVTHRVHRVPSNRSKPEGRMEVDVPRCPHGTHGMIRGACGAFHVDAKRQGYVGMAECYGVDSLVESESAGHAVAEHLHDRSRQRQPQIVREKGREIFLECVRWEEGEKQSTHPHIWQTPP